MAKLRLRDPDYVLIADALLVFRSEEQNKVCADYAQQFGIDAMRLAEQQVQHCNNLLERIRRARSI